MVLRLILMGRFERDASSHTFQSLIATSMAADETPEVPVDLAVLSTLFGDDHALIATILEDFTVSMEAYLREFSTAGDLSEVRAVAHKLKSSARTVGAGPLGNLCAALEHACRNDQAEVAASLLSHIPPEVIRINDFLAEQRPSDTPGR